MNDLTAFARCLNRRTVDKILCHSILGRTRLGKSHDGGKDGGEESEGGGELHGGGSNDVVVGW